MTLGGNQDRFMSDINVTPFVDVMLVLLIIFMVTAPLMMEGMDVALPEATAKPIASDDQQLMITIDATGAVYINDIQVSVDNLQEKLVKIIDGQLNRAIYLKADKDIAYGRVVRVMSEIKEAGIEKLGMVTIPISNESEKRN